MFLQNRCDTATVVALLRDRPGTARMSAGRYGISLIDAHSYVGIAPLMRTLIPFVAAFTLGLNTSSASAKSKGDELLREFLDSVGKTAQQELQLVSHIKRCNAGDLTACDTALKSPHLTEEIRFQIQKKRLDWSSLFKDLDRNNPEKKQHGGENASWATLQYELCVQLNDRASCGRALEHLSSADSRRGEVDAIISGLPSTTTTRPVAPEKQTASIAIPPTTSNALPIPKEITLRSGGLPRSQFVGVPTSTKLASGLALVLTLILSSIAIRFRSHYGGAIGVRRRAQRITARTSSENSAKQAARTFPGGEFKIDGDDLAVDEDRVRSDDTVLVSPQADRASPETPPVQAPQAHDPSPTVPSDHVPHDRLAATTALQIAFTYLQEAEQEIIKSMDVPSLALGALDIILLSLKQLNAAERADPQAELTVEDEEGQPQTYSQAHFRSLALTGEARCRGIEDPHSAVIILEKAIDIHPGNSSAHFLLGLYHKGLSNTEAAVAALEKAVELNCGDIEWNNELDRARNITAEC